MSIEKKEKRILLLSFGAGLLFALAEFIFAIYSHSQSALMDAAYDASELVFIVLILFLTPLFHMPISEKRPYGYFQIESIFILIKGIAMLSVTFGLSANVIKTIVSGGIQVNGTEISIFQLILGIASIFIFAVMKHLNRSVSSPTVTAELLGWKIDIAYSIGMSLAFFIVRFIDQTPLSFLSPYFDQIIALAVVLFTLPECLKMLRDAVKNVFLFSPDAGTVGTIKAICNEVLTPFAFDAVFYDITRTGRKLWIAVYFKISEDCLYIDTLEKASAQLNARLDQEFENFMCELILVSGHSQIYAQPGNENTDE